MRRILQKMALSAVLASTLFTLVAPISIQAAPVALQPFSQFASCAKSGAAQIEILPSWDKYLSCGTDGEITDFAFPDDIWLVVFALVEILIRIALYSAVAFVIWGGINMIISQGNPEKIQGARQTIEQALIGMVIAMLATGIVLIVERGVT